MANILHTAYCMLFPFAKGQSSSQNTRKKLLFAKGRSLNKIHVTILYIDLSKVTLVKLATTSQVAPDDTHVERKSCVLHGIRLIKHMNCCCSFFV